MEGAGKWDILLTILVKSACDYADSYKSKVWQLADIDIGILEDYRCGIRTWLAIFSLDFVNA